MRSLTLTSLKYKVILRQVGIKLCLSPGNVRLSDFFWAIMTLIFLVNLDNIIHRDKEIL